MTVTAAIITDHWHDHDHYDNLLGCQCPYGPARAPGPGRLACRQAEPRQLASPSHARRSAADTARGRGGRDSEPPSPRLSTAPGAESEAAHPVAGPGPIPNGPSLEPWAAVLDTVTAPRAAKYAGAVSSGGARVLESRPGHGHRAVGRKLSPASQVGTVTVTVTLSASGESRRVRAVCSGPESQVPGKVTTE